MKKKTFFRCLSRYLVLTLLMLNGISVHSQGTILSGNQYSEFSIIRNYEKSIDITYNVILDTLTFNYIDRNTMVTHSVNLNNEFLVWDFVVFHDSVFFCGEGNMTAVFGYFDIQDVFFNSGNIIYYTFPANYQIYSLGRIDVTTALSGATHLLMTGRGYPYFSNTIFSDKDNIDSTSDAKRSFYPGTIVEAWKYTSNIFNIRYIAIDTNNIYLYDDVAFTDNYAVITAHTTDNATTHNLFYYKSPTSTINGYLDCWTSTPPLSNTPMLRTSISTLMLGNNTDIRITKMQQDSFATACRNLIDNNITISIYHDPTQQSVNRFSISGSTYCQELVYNSRQQALYVLDDNLYHIKHPFTSSTKLVESHNNWLSLDNTNNETLVILSGWDPSTTFIYPKMYWLFNINSMNSCYQRNNVNNNFLNNTDHPNYCLQTILHNLFEPRSFSPIARTFVLNIICP